jgi:exodeoxyribonuclease V alpha subunit
MWLERLKQAHIIDSTAYAMGNYIQQNSASVSKSSSILCALCIQALKNGHTCLDCKNIILQFPSLSQFPELLNIIELDSLLEHPLIGQNYLHENTLFTYCSTLLFTNKFFALETKLIYQLASRLNTTQIKPASNNVLQLAELCFIKPLTILSGGPGTGKTTVFAQALPYWIKQYQSKHSKMPRIILCAPTGKAAARMTESWIVQRQKLESDSQFLLITSAFPDQAITIHRLLGVHPINRLAKFNEQNLLPLDLLIIDEASMLDLPIFVKLLEACSSGAHILLIGDQQQLPAIEAGNILGSLFDTNSNCWFYQQLQSAQLHLSHNYRQQHNLGLSDIADDCLIKPVDVVISNLGNNAYPNVLWLDNNYETLYGLINYASAKYIEMTNCNNVEQVLLNVHSYIILTAVRDGTSGCIAINHEIIRRINPNLQAYYHGQILLITENANHLNLANGDIVIIWQEDQTLNAYFSFNGSTYNIAIDNLPKHEPAYALTIHKAQGSEYEEVNIVLPPYESSVLSKSLIYTGITRAKNKLQIIATQESLISGLNNVSKRVNGLHLFAEKLMQQEIQ